MSKDVFTHPLAFGPPNTPNPIPGAPFGTGAVSEIFQL